MTVKLGRTETTSGEREAPFKPGLNGAGMRREDSYRLPWMFWVDAGLLDGRLAAMASISLPHGGLIDGNLQARLMRLLVPQ